MPPKDGKREAEDDDDKGEVEVKRQRVNAIFHYHGGIDSGKVNGEPGDGDSNSTTGKGHGTSSPVPCPTDSQQGPCLCFESCVSGVCSSSLGDPLRSQGVLCQDRRAIVNGSRLFDNSPASNKEEFNKVRYLVVLVIVI